MQEINRTYPKMNFKAKGEEILKESMKINPRAYMSDLSQMRLIKKIIAGRPLQQIKVITKILDQRENKINDRRCEQWTRSLKHKIRICGIRRYVS